MKTPTIQAALNNTFIAASRSVNQGKADGSEDRPSFSQILSGQSAVNTVATDADTQTGTALVRPEPQSAGKKKIAEWPEMASATSAAPSILTALEPAAGAALRANRISADIQTDGRGPGAINEMAATQTAPASAAVRALDDNGQDPKGNMILAAQDLSPPTATGTVSSAAANRSSHAATHQTRLTPVKKAIQAGRDPDLSQTRSGAPARASANLTTGSSAVPAFGQAFTDATVPILAQDTITPSSGHEAFPGEHTGHMLTPETGINGLALNSLPTHNPASTASLTINNMVLATPLQHPRWANDFGQQFLTLTRSGANMPRIAELRLDPPDLGPLHISILVSDNVAHAHFVSSHAAVRHAVESALPGLQQLLAQAGISLGQTSVNDQSSSQHMFEHSPTMRRHPGGGAIVGNSLESSSEISAGPIRSKAPLALIDTFA